MRFLEATVDIDVDGRPDMKTLLVSGTGATENREEIRRWIESGFYTPGTDGLGRPIRAPYKLRIRVSGG